MKSKSTIEMDFNLARQKANELENIAGNVTNISGNLTETLEAIPNSWASNSSNEYIRKGTEISGQIQNSANNLNRTAETIKTIARNVYEAEMEALRIAEERAARERAEAEARRIAEEQAAALANNKMV